MSCVQCQPPVSEVEVLRTHHLDVVAFAEELAHGKRALPKPQREDDQVANHDARPFKAALWPCAGVDALRLFSLRHHQVADEHDDQADALVLVQVFLWHIITSESDVERRRLVCCRIEQQVREQQARKEWAI